MTSEDIVVKRNNSMLNVLRFTFYALCEMAWKENRARSGKTTGENIVKNNDEKYLSI